MTSLSEFLKDRASFRAQWLFLALLFVPLGWYYWTQVYSLHHDRADMQPPQGRPGVDWFLTLHLPDITAQYESGIETMRVRVDEWLDALVKAGYHPMRLSEVYTRLAQEHMLPEKTVVVFFSPSFKRTLDVVGPHLAQREIPAVWLTDEHALDRLDRRFVTYEATRRMKRSGLWDVGFAKRGEIFRLESTKGPDIQLGTVEAPAWSPYAGAYAVNWGPVQSGINFLTIIADWTAEDLINRLRAETPVQDSVSLITGPIQNRSWGMSLSTSSATNPAFDLDSPLDKKSARFFWLCTRHRSDFALQMDVTSLLGELWLRLRYDEDSGDGIFIVQSGGQLLVMQHHAMLWKRLLSVGMPARFHGKELRVSLAVNGSDLTLTANSQGPWHLHVVPEDPGAKGIVELYVSDRMRGVARAKGVHLIYTPVITMPAAQ